MPDEDCVGPGEMGFRESEEARRQETSCKKSAGSRGTEGSDGSQPAEELLPALEAKGVTLRVEAERRRDEFGRFLKDALPWLLAQGWQIAGITRSEIKVVYNTEVTADIVQKEKPKFDK